MMRNSLKAFYPVVILFLVLNGFFIAGKNMLERWGADQDVLIIGNLVLFGITLISFLVAKRGLNHSNPHAFVRSAYGSIMIKLFICIIAAFIYIAAYKKDLNKPALFTLMGLYLLYTFIEVSSLMKLLKQRTNE
jgi:cobalamin biosynthesis protein CobD/CbiB